MSKLGKNQLQVIDCMRRTSNRWWAGSGWAWGTYSSTTRILDSLVKRGLVTKGVIQLSNRAPECYRLVDKS